MGTLYRNRSRTSGTSGTAGCSGPAHLQPAPSPERASALSSCGAQPGPRWPPSPASPALGERGSTRVHPERPERVICEEAKVGVSQPALVQGHKSRYWGSEKYCALRNLPQSGPSPRSKTASFGSRADSQAVRTEAGSYSHSLRWPPAGLRETVTRASPSRAEKVGTKTAQGRPCGGGGEGPQQSTIAP